MSVINFNCQKCGYCCRNLLTEVKGILNGLFLTSKEVRMFDSKIVSPQIAIGRKKAENILSWQLNVNVCPYINEKSECEIYDKRPLACKSFPIEMTLSGVNIMTNCKFIGSQMKEGEKRVIEFSAIEKEAGEKINRYLLNRLQKYARVGSRLRKFDLRTEKWFVRE